MYMYLFLSIIMMYLFLSIIMLYYYNTDTPGGKMQAPLREIFEAQHFQNLHFANKMFTNRESGFSSRTWTIEDRIRENFGKGGPFLTTDLQTAVQ